MNIAGNVGDPQVVTAAANLNSANVEETIFNSASPITQALPASPVPGQRHRLTNFGAGVVTVTGNIQGNASNSVTIAAISAGVVTSSVFVFSSVLATWVQRL